MKSQTKNPAVVAALVVEHSLLAPVPLLLAKSRPISIAIAATTKTLGPG